MQSKKLIKGKNTCYIVVEFPEGYFKEIQLKLLNLHTKE